MTRDLQRELFPSHFEEKEVTETETEVEESQEETPESDSEQEETSDTGENETPEVNDWEIKYNELLSEQESKDKRIKDNQRNFHKVNNAYKQLVDNLVQEGVYTEEQAQEHLKSYMAEEKDPVTVIAEETKAELEKVKHVMNARGEPVEEYYENFAKLSMLDNSVIEDLKQLPAEQRLTYILDKGQEAESVLNIINEHNGSIVEALTSVKSDKSLKQAEERGYEKAKAEYEAQLAEYISGAQQKPKLKSSSNKAPGKSEETQSSPFMNKLNKFA